MGKTSIFEERICKNIGWYWKNISQFHYLSNIQVSINTVEDFPQNGAIWRLSEHALSTTCILESTLHCCTLPTISSFFGKCSYRRRNTIWDLPIIKKSTMTTNMKISFLSLQFQLQYQNCVQEVEIWKHHSLILWPPQFITNKYLNLRMKLSYLAKNCLLRKYSL